MWRARLRRLAAVCSARSSHAPRTDTRCPGLCDRTPPPPTIRHRRAARVPRQARTACSARYHSHVVHMRRTCKHRTVHVARHTLYSGWAGRAHETQRAAAPPLLGCAACSLRLTSILYRRYSTYDVDDVNRPSGSCGYVSHEARLMGTAIKRKLVSSTLRGLISPLRFSPPSTARLCKLAAALVWVADGEAPNLTPGVRNASLPSG
jgi:hypothetical protein